jgi:hypothetical protein
MSAIMTSESRLKYQFVHWLSDQFASDRRARCRSCDLKRYVLRNADLSDQGDQCLAQIGQRILASDTVADRSGTGPYKHGRAPYSVLVLLDGISHMHDTTHRSNLDQLTAAA